MNDLPNCPLASDTILYADGNVLYYSSKDLTDLQSHLNAVLETVSELFSRNLVTLNLSKCNFVVFGSPHKLQRIQVKGTIIDRTESLQYLGVTRHQSMS